MTKARLILVVVLLVAVQATLLSSSLRRKSPTADELNYLAAGVAAWRTGDFRLFRDPPPAQSLLCSLPALFWWPELPLESTYWLSGRWNGFGEAFARRNRESVLAMLSASRGLAIFLACGVSLVAFTLAKRLYGPSVAICVSALTVFDPNLAAHGRLVTTDIGATLAYICVAAALLGWFSSPSLRTLLLLSIASGAACLFKHSGLLLIPPVMVCLIWVARRVEWTRWRIAGVLPAYLLTVLLVIWIGYGFETIDPITGHFKPLASYLTGVARQWTHARTGQPSYLLGQFTTESSWYFYPVIFFIKTPLPTLILLAVGIYPFARDRRRWPEGFPVLLPGLILLGALVFLSRAAVGYRHLLPALPLLLVVFCGAAVSLLSTQLRLGLPVLGCLVGWLIISHLLIWPHYLAYFNELVGGPRNGHLCAVDSNLDWGQDLPLVTEYVRSHPNGPIGLIYFGPAFVTQLLAVPAIPMQDWGSEIPTRVAISATALHGVSSGGRLNFWQLFADQEPLAMLGYSILVYKTPDVWR